jgi:hypothetical protein
LSGCQITLSSRIDSYIKVGDPLEPQAYVHAPQVALELNGDDLLTRSALVKALPGAELQVVIERVTDKALPRELSGKIALDALKLDPSREHPLFITARQRDQSRVWTSALFVSF